MRGHKFTEEERKQLESNPNIEKVLGCNVEYTSAFKAYALNAADEGKHAMLIFSEAGIPDWLN